MVDFGRVLTAMVSPFDARGNLNLAVAEKLADRLVEDGTDTLVVCGTTGESPTLTRAEQLELIQVVKSAVSTRAKVIAGTGSNSTASAIDFTQKAAKLGVDGSLQVVPYYNKPPQQGLYEHFRAIASACPDLPVMLYNIPGRTGVNLEPETIAELAEISNIVAVKEASGDLEQVARIRTLTSPEFVLYSGDDALTLPLLSIGCRGVVSVASHLVGRSLQEMVRAFEAGQTQHATEIHLRLLPLFKALFLTANPIPLKFALQQLGWDVGRCRPPLSEATDDVRQTLKEVLDRLELLP
ncbi:MAG: 4-hydroxy-tetrahydrodipicolinate synthase [Cyanobacteriota bacterium]|nr:4-hydroxy-tetrahydrodipicolinate synthase [Cyanobacteriota bacterium]